MKLLSIDWDYFVQATRTERIELLPDITSETWSYAIVAGIWLSRYSYSKKLSELSIKKEDYKIFNS